MRAARNVAQYFSGKCERRINLDRGEAKIIRRYSNHYKTLAVEIDRFSQQIGIGAKAPLPQTVTQYRHSITAGFLLFRQKGAAELRLDSQCLEEVRRNVQPIEPFRLSASGKSVAIPGIC